MPKGTTQSALSGRGAGHGQAGGLDTHVVRSCRAAADAHSATLFAPAVVGRPAGSGVVQVVLACQQFWRAGRGEPIAQRVEQSFAQHVGLKNPAVKQYVRGPHRVALIAALRLKKGRKMAGHGRIGLEGQPDFAEPGNDFLHRPVRYFTAGEETLGQSSVMMVRSTSTDTVPPIIFRPRPSTVTLCFSGPSGVSKISFAVRQECQSATDCQGSSLTPFSAKSPADVMGQGQVHVVAAD